MDNPANKLTFAGIGVFLLFAVSAGLGFCGKPADQPKPAPSVSTSK